MLTAANRGLILALTGIVLLLAVTLVAYRPVAPLGPEASPAVFSAYRATAILRDLVGDGVPHPIGSPANARLRETIVRKLSALGYATELQSGFVCNDAGTCGSPVNIIATPRDSAAADGTILLAAHYDSVPAGPGASDDGSGVAVLLEIARILAARPALPHPIALLITDGEEAGLLGAWLFVRDHPLSKRVSAAVNVEARGTAGPSLMFETGGANSWLMGLFAAAIARPMTNSLYYVVYKQLDNDTDFTVFKNAGYQGFNFAFIGQVGRYHTPLDTVAHADPSSIQHQGDNALAVLTALAGATNPQPPFAESVFFDVLARRVIAWPSAYTLPAALLSSILLLAEIVILLCRKAVTGRQILWGCVGALGMLATGLGLSVGILALGLSLGKVPPLTDASWIAHPLPMHLAAAAIALAVASAVGAGFARRAGFWGFWVAAVVISAALAVAGAVWLPGASYAWLMTAGAAALGALPCAVRWVRSRAPTQWAGELAALLPAFVFFGSVFPLLQFLYTGLGSLAWPVSTLLLSLGAAMLLPLLAGCSHQLQRVVMIGAAALVVGGTLVTLALPTYSTDWPERINLEYWLDADTGQSTYLARADSLHLPESLAAAAHFDAVPRPRFAGSGVMVFAAAAPPMTLAPPRLTLLSSAITQGPGEITHFTVHLDSARAAPEVLVVFPATAHISTVDFAASGNSVRPKLRRLKGGATLLDIVGLPAAGVEFGFDAAGPLPLAIQVFDQSFDFPENGNLPGARPPKATSSQDGDLTVVHRTASLDPRPAAGN